MDKDNLEKELRDLLKGAIVTSFGHTSPNTGSHHKDFYVYEWVISDTEEIFYVGKGRGNRATEYHHNNLYAEKIRETHDVEIKIIADNLTEEEALILEEQEIIRIKTETPYVLTNISVPFGYENARKSSKSTPALSFETAPMIYASEVEEHYFGKEGKTFSEITPELLKNVFFIERMVQPQIKEIIYGNQYEKYYSETEALLKASKRKVYVSQYAKSISAWIYCGAPSLEAYNDDQEKAMERLGHSVPVFHLIDVWKYLKSTGVELKETETEMKACSVNPINNRIPYGDIKVPDDELEALRCGQKDIEKGFEFYYEGEYESAIKFFDKAREKGCIDPVMFNYYAVMYRKLKDYDNEIDILSEAIFRYENLNPDIYGKHILDFKKRQKKAYDLLAKRK